MMPNSFITSLLTFGFLSLINAAPADITAPRLAKRATCGTWHTNGKNFQTSDLKGLVNQQMALSPENNIVLNAEAMIIRKYGGVQACLWNPWAFENTHTSEWEVGWAAQQVLNTCCQGGQCNGGEQPASGDDKLGLRLFVTEINDDSCGHPNA
jgi:hypothetical protein